MFNYESSPTLTNCVFSGNHASSQGGGMWNFWCSPFDLTNCTFSGNSANTEGGAIRNETSSPTLTNCILWANAAGNFGDEVYNIRDSSPTFSYCDIEGSGGSASWDTSLGTDGGNNIDADPLFVSQPDHTAAPTTAGDVHLQKGSPCIDSGNNAAVAVSTDFEGDPRIMDGDSDGMATVDMGADEFMQEPGAATAVGGDAYAVDTLGILMPWVALLALLAGGVGFYGWRRRRAHC